MPFVRVNGVVLHHAIRGKADGPVLVFSNSLGTDFRIWDEVTADLARDYRIVLYDKRGHGLSEATPQPYRLEDHVGDLAALLDHLGVTQASVIGLSVGGLIAQALASARPDLVKSLVLCDTSSDLRGPGWEERIRITNEEGIAVIADAIMTRWFAPAFRRPDNAAYVGYLAMLTRTPVEGYAGTCAALRDANQTEATRALKLPVMCLVGDQDGSTPPDTVRALAELIDGASFHIIPGAGHIPCVEQPAITTRLIRDFLAHHAH